MKKFDVVVVGVGFTGMYMVHKLVSAGFSVRAIEAGKGPGGTWYWNRYPGARCDIESVEYQYGFDDQVHRDWTWSERYATQPEILRYINHMADKLGVHEHTDYDTRVSAAVYDEDAHRWTVTTERGDVLDTHFLVMATGSLSATNIPNFPGRDDFGGNIYHTGGWPHEGVDFSGRRVAVIGTGSSGVQAIPIIGEQASELTVFQRTPTYSLPAFNRPVPVEVAEAFKDEFPGIRERVKHSRSGTFLTAGDKSVLELSKDEVYGMLDSRWTAGGFAFLTSFTDILTSTEANEIVAGYVRDRIAKVINDPAMAKKLIPTDYPLGAKRPCLDTNYFQTFNDPKVTLVDVRESPIEKIVRNGIVAGGQTYEADDIVFATGFDAMTGALTRIDIRGTGGQTIKDKWAAGPQTYLGVGVHGFPNFFQLVGPGSPSVLANVIMAAEQHVEWVTDCLIWMRDHGKDSIEANADAEHDWGELVNEFASHTLFPLGNSWLLGANIPGKKRVFMPYIGGLGLYRKTCDEVAAEGYRGFTLAQ
jgi:cyclohexanone monooxygenase